MSGDFDIAKIDEIIHGRLRLGIMAYLSTAEVAEFNELKEKLSTSDGNLSVHLRKLEEAGYVTIRKSFSGRKPLTRVRAHRQGPRRVRDLSRRDRTAPAQSRRVMRQERGRRKSARAFRSLSDKAQHGYP